MSDALYISYWSFGDPLFQSQSLPYLRGLAAQGHRFVVVTFEQLPFRLSPAERSARQAALRAEGIEWVPLRYTKSPPLLSKAFDIGRGALVCARLARRCGLVHARSTVPGAIGYLATRLVRRPFFYDADGPLSQEYVDVGAWAPESVPHRATRWMEQRAMRAADRVAVLTRSRAAEVQPAVEQPVAVLPCAVDVDWFRPASPEARARVRAELGLQGTVFLYSGKAGGWYATDEMFAFLAAARPAFPDLQVLVLTGGDPAPFHAAAARVGLTCVARKATRDDMPAYLSAADAGLSFIKAAPSKRACSPIKNAEYLACGLPVVTTTGVGDYTALVAEERVGVVVDPARPDAFADRARDLAALLADPSLRARCRAVAVRDLAIRSVVAQYGTIYEQLVPAGSGAAPLPPGA